MPDYQAEWKRFRQALNEVYDLRAAIALLQWDQEVFMPPKGALARGCQLATLSALAHRAFTAPEWGERLDKLAGADHAISTDERLLIAETRHDYLRATRLPESFVHAFAAAQSAAYEAWAHARAQSDFAAFRPHLETMVELARQKADYLGYEGSPYDALLEEYERGMTVAQLRPLLADLAAAQGALAGRIAANNPQPDAGWLEQEWNEEAQWKLTCRVLRDMGFDFSAGRQDRSLHPFTTNFDLCDVRITTRTNPRELFSALTGSMHEGGHALYEQGFLENDRRTTLAEGISLGIHESQSRMWENIIGKSLPFWKRYAPIVRQAFPGQLDAVTPEQFYAAINRVQPSLIRVEADECTYNLHIVLRFEIEVALIEGDLAVADVPGAWNEKMRRYLGIDVPDDARGCLQDIHWAHGSMGYFPTYALGNLYAAQLFEAMSRDLPELWSFVEAGDFGPLREWLRIRVHQVGRRKTAVALLQDVTGQPPSAGPFLAYLTRKYESLYGS
ncbi:MAG TPA: carboxypeptidase M32 [Candidatus Hydrogenedentes bacterium]|nr:carboxypeptidase M32 [Candidatus Hydrogenedentota bacterium]HOS03358.1 carboxypeptidase M32 [Candidatus Hydrogenedentota bacterium]